MHGIGPVDAPLSTIAGLPSPHFMSDFLNIEDDAPLRRMLYATAFLLIVIPFLQAISQLLPLQLGNLQWRFLSANPLSSVLLLPFLGMLLLLMMARALANRGLSLFVGILAAIFALLLAASLVLFVLDGLQLKAIVNSAQTAQFQNVFARVTAVTVIFVVVFTMMALAALKAPKGSPLAMQKGVKQADEGVGLIVGRV